MKLLKLQTYRIKLLKLKKYRMELLTYRMKLLKLLTYQTFLPQRIFSVSAINCTPNILRSFSDEMDKNTSRSFVQCGCVAAKSWTFGPHCTWLAWIISRSVLCCSHKSNILFATSHGPQACNCSSLCTMSLKSAKVWRVYFPGRTLL